MNILLFGASGNLGRQIARVAHQRGHAVTAVVRNKQKAAQLASCTSNSIIADVSQPQALNGICNGFDVVVSALGKSVSPADKSKPSFDDIDLAANTRILEDARKCGVKQFVYISALHAERYPQLTYFRVHQQFSERLQQSGINYAIIKPPALFSAFVEMLEMAQKGMLVSMGPGDKKTNPIYEGDLAEITVDAIGKNNVVVEAGGQHVYTRRQLLDIIQTTAAPHKKVRVVPMGMIRFSLPLLKLTNRNTYDKVAFFAAVMQQDTLAPHVGATKFEDYIRAKAQHENHY